MAIAPITASGTGDTVVVAAVAGKKIRVMRVVLSALTANNVILRAGTTPITGIFYLGATSAVAFGGSNVTNDSLFDVPVGSALNVNLSAATAVGGFIDYTLE